MDPLKSTNSDESNEPNPVFASRLQPNTPPRSHGGSATTSPVWTYFKLNEDNPIQATCLMCGTLMSRGGVFPSRCGTTNLRRHLSFAHGIILPSKKKPQQLIPPAMLQQSETQTFIAPKPKQKKPLVFSEPSHEPSVYEICLRWKSYNSNMQSMFPTLLNNQHFVDVTLACEGRSIKCHRVILSACSSYFEDILCNTTCHHPIIIIKDLHFQELRTLVDFMYCGEAYVAQERLPMLLAAAEALQIKGLSGSSTAQDEDIFSAGSFNERKYSDAVNVNSKQKSTIREKYQNLPGTSHSINVSGDKPNGLQHAFTSAGKSSTSCTPYIKKPKLKSPQNLKSKSVAYQDDKKSSTLSGETQQRKGESELQDVIITNDSICPAPICELSEESSTNREEDDALHREGEMEDMYETDDYSEGEDDDVTSVGLIMAPEVVMDCSDDTES